MNERGDGHLIVLGCGDVGKRVIETLQHAGINFIVVDSDPDKLENADFEHIIGNATEEDILMDAGIETASEVIITLNDDTDVIFATLIARGLNPKSTIISRANSYRSIDKIYKAGADYVASLSIVAGQMLARMTSHCLEAACKKMDEDIMLYEGIDIEKHHVTGGSNLNGKTVEELNLRKSVGCTIIGIERGEEIITDILPSTTIEENDVIAVVGGKEEINLFKEKYVKKNK
ncbi:TrkA family potassium uptake protein [Methanolobus zinderi]|uniref:TrkA family potassium uptake protein n=1 Tax=Methanolobus zinderi TaxID=536044 RepID=A0A7D5E903_9EURY|nr:TrkA family potassium uptake protein [Methanolobus zinderi]QLC49755.1 TrkA family potassium uptake protein [Methanolobus zinderi]